MTATSTQVLRSVVLPAAPDEVWKLVGDTGEIISIEHYGESADDKTLFREFGFTPEKVLEAYYALAINSWSTFTFDYQFVANPAYNADRGPVSFYSLRYHAEW